MVVDKEVSSKSKLLSMARQHCANWNNGNCLGCMMRTYNNMIIFRISSKFADKSCQVDKKCRYFDDIVTPGIKNGI
jgi:hypothetical protein